MAMQSYKDSQGFKSISYEAANSLLSYDAETGILTWKPREGDKAFNTRRAGKPAGCRHVCTVGKAYIQVRVRDELHHAHRVIWAMVHGNIPDRMQVDHINGDGTDNRLCNLRLVTPSENKRNMRRLSNNSTGRVGVHLDKNGKYYAKAWFNGKPKHLGFSSDFAGAVALREAWEKEQGYHANHGADRPL